MGGGAPGGGEWIVMNTRSLFMGKNPMGGEIWCVRGWHERSDGGKRGIGEIDTRR